MDVSDRVKTIIKDGGNVTDADISSALVTAKEFLASLGDVSETELVYYVCHILYKEGKIRLPESINHNGVNVSFDKNSDGNPYMEIFNSLRMGKVSIAGVV